MCGHTYRIFYFSLNTYILYGTTVCTNIGISTSTEWQYNCVAKSLATRCVMTQSSGVMVQETQDDSLTNNREKESAA